MHHYLYKVTSESGRYYVGRHSTNNLDDGYTGSGKWVRSIKDRTKLTKEIISFHDSIEELREAEEILIKECIEDELNMNFNLSSVGFSTGAQNPAHRADVKAKRSEWSSGDNNPAKKKEARKKISDALKKWHQENDNPNLGREHTEEAREKMRAAATGRTASEETRKTLSEINRKRMLEGRNPNFNRVGAKHTEESKAKMSEAQKNRPKGKCKFCGKEVSINVLNRWHNDNCKEKNRTELQS